MICPAMNVDYVAGLFDGEGCAILTVSRSKTSVWGWDVTPVVSISNNSRELIEEVRNFLGLGRISKSRSTYQLMIGREVEVKRFIEQVKPRVLLKRRQLILLEEALRYLPGGYTWQNLISRDSMIALVDYASRIRQLNRQLNRTGRGNDLNQVLQEIMAVPEDRVTRRERTRREMLKNSALKRMKSVPLAELEHLYRFSPLKITEIAEHFGVGERMIYRRLKLLGITRTPRSLLVHCEQPVAL